MNMIAEMTSSKSSFESSFFNEYPLVRSRTSSFSTNNATSSYASPFFSQQNNQQCYTRSLFSHLQQQEEEEELEGLNSLPRFLSTTNNYSGVMESTNNNNETWAYYHNDMFNTNNMFSSFDGINSVTCQ
ncbi:8306_t:CDS:2 [Funneliformis geosporum]|nr:8306_t:CDS:2 [Funneliformis geosporum]